MHVPKQRRGTRGGLRQKKKSTSDMLPASGYCPVSRHVGTRRQDFTPQPTSGPPCVRRNSPPRGARLCPIHMFVLFVSLFTTVALIVFQTLLYVRSLQLVEAHYRSQRLAFLLLRTPSGCVAIPLTEENTRAFLDHQQTRVRHGPTSLVCECDLLHESKNNSRCNDSGAAAVAAATTSDFEAFRSRCSASVDSTDFARDDMRCFPIFFRTRFDPEPSEADFCPQTRCTPGDEHVAPIARRHQADTETDAGACGFGARPHGRVRRRDVFCRNRFHPSVSSMGHPDDHCDGAEEPGRSSASPTDSPRTEHCLSFTYWDATGHPEPEPLRTSAAAHGPTTLSPCHSV